MGMRYSDYVDYEKLDLVKRMALEKFMPTTSHPERFRIKYRIESVGETSSVYEFLDYDFMIAFIIESLGTKILDPDRIRGKMEISQEFLGKQIYKGIGQDAIAMPVYDLNAVGALPIGLGDILASGVSDYFEKDMDRTEQLLDGFKIGADLAKASLACGDTPTLKDLVNPESLVIMAAGFGIVKPKERFTEGGRKIQAGDILIGFESNGIHSNGLTLARAIVEKSPEGYTTKLPNGEMIGEALLKPTKIYTGLIEDLFKAGVEIHYIIPVTGHSYQKIARSKLKPFTYKIEFLPEPQPEFAWLQEIGPVTKKEAYRTWNMGIGMVIVVPSEYEEAIAPISRKHGIEYHVLGKVEEGPRQVVMPFKENGKPVLYIP